MRNLTDEETEIYNKRIEAEAADVQPVKHGKWEKKKGYLICSNCGMSVDTIGYTYEEQEEVFRYCSCCGYRMDLNSVTYDRCSNYMDCKGRCEK